MLVGTLGFGGFGARSFFPPSYGVQFIQHLRDTASLPATVSLLISFTLPAVLSISMDMPSGEWGVGRVLGLPGMLCSA